MQLAQHTLRRKLGLHTYALEPLFHDEPEIICVSVANVRGSMCFSKMEVEDEQVRELAQSAEQACCGPRDGEP